MRIIVVLLFNLFLQITPMDACTSFIINQGGRLLLAKNLDWPVGEGYIFINGRGIVKSSFPQDHSKNMTWESQYGNITFNQFGRDFPLGGLNEMGLVIEEMNFSPSEYPKAHTTLNEFQWIQYHLDNSQSTAEVIKSLDSLSISPFLFRLHYLICDKSGHAAVIEFIDHEAKVYTNSDLSIPVLSNNSYYNSIRYIKHYDGFGGERQVSNRSDSQERFVRAATLIKNYSSQQHVNMIDKASEILASVKQADTQWSILYDIGKMNIIFNTKTHHKKRSLRFSEYDFNKSVLFSNINSSYLENTIPEFEKYTVYNNDSLIDNVFAQMIKINEIDEIAAMDLVKRFQAYSRTY